MDDSEGKVNMAPMPTRHQICSWALGLVSVGGAYHVWS